jgi:hypothetical protein
VLEPPADLLAFAGLRRPFLSVTDPLDDARALLGGGP